MDKEQVIRRLGGSELSYDTSYPEIILSKLKLSYLKARWWHCST